MRFFDTRAINYIDWVSLFLILFLTGIGLAFVLSSTYAPEQPISTFFKKQLFGIISGLIIYLIFCFFDYRILCREGYTAYFIVLVLLLFTIIKGHVGMGAKRWMSIGLFKFQPSELVKLFFPAFVTTYYAHATLHHPPSIGFFTSLIALLLASTLLILKQPDLGTALIILFSGVIMLWIMGIGKKFFIYAALIFVGAAPITWHFLKPYQRKRIEVFLGGGDKQKERYQIEQSAIAIGSGGLFGKGFLKGTQNILRFLPESRTDFIFSVICEEWGFLGAILIIFLYAFLFLRIFAIIKAIPMFPAKLLAIGLFVHILLSTLINIMMVIGLLPIVGIPLPLISYGITNLWITFASLGWINGIFIRRTM